MRRVRWRKDGKIMEGYVVNAIVKRVQVGSGKTARGEDQTFIVIDGTDGIFHELPIKDAQIV